MDWIQSDSGQLKPIKLVSGTSHHSLASTVVMGEQNWTLGGCLRYNVIFFLWLIQHNFYYQEVHEWSFKAVIDVKLKLIEKKIYIYFDKFLNFFFANKNRNKGNRIIIYKNKISYFQTLVLVINLISLTWVLSSVYNDSDENIL